MPRERSWPPQEGDVDKKKPKEKPAEQPKPPRERAKKKNTINVYSADGLIEAADPGVATSAEEDASTSSAAETSPDIKLTPETAEAGLTRALELIRAALERLCKDSGNRARLETKLPIPLSKGMGELRGLLLELTRLWKEKKLMERLNQVAHRGHIDLCEPDFESSFPSLGARWFEKPEEVDPVDAMKEGSPAGGASGGRSWV